MKKILPETTESPFCFSVAKLSSVVVFITAEIVNWTVYHIYSCQQFSSSFNTMACHLPVLEQYSLQMANTATVFSYSYIVFSKNCSRFNLRMANFQNFSCWHASDSLAS